MTYSISAERGNPGEIGASHSREAQVGPVETTLTFCGCEGDPIG